MKNEIGVIGAGSWGTALANLLGEKNITTTLWVFEKELCERMIKTKENNLYLPGFKLSENIIPTNSLKNAVQGKNVIISAIPSHVVRKISKEYQQHLEDNALIVSVSKGIEEDTLMTMSEVLENTLSGKQNIRLAFLSGPSFAKEVITKLPTAVVIASRNQKAAKELQAIFAAGHFRTYTTPDVKGVEIGGATKNVIAIAVGISDGLGLGDNTRAALITRGLREIVRLGTKMGADPITFSGLSGIGDLVLTCTGSLSRNRSVGLNLGRGIKLKDITKGMTMVAEGIKTTRAIYLLSKKLKVEMPIVKQTYMVLYQAKPPKEAVNELMNRELKNELE